MILDSDGVGLQAVRDTVLVVIQGCLSLEDSSMALAGEMVMVTSRKRTAETIYAGNECNEMNAGLKRQQVQQDEDTCSFNFPLQQQQDLGPFWISYVRPSLPEKQCVANRSREPWEEEQLSVSLAPPLTQVCAEDDGVEMQDTADSSESSDTSGCSCHRTSPGPRPALQQHTPAAAATAAAAEAAAAAAVEEDGGVTSPRRPAPAAAANAAGVIGARADESSLYCWEVLQLSLDDM